MASTKSSKGISTRYQPPLYITEKQLPAIKDWKVGGKYQLLVDVEQVGIQNPNASEMMGMEIGSDNEKDEGLEARFKITKVSLSDDESGESDVSTYLKKKATS